jgi:Uncharacterized alpha/beta hydrolase domain (DUF2235)
LWKPKPEVTSQAKKKPPTSVKEMWFAGAHAGGVTRENFEQYILMIVSTDVGGSAEMDTAPASLSNITLRWMLCEIQSANCGIIFDNDALDRMKIPTDCVARLPRPNLRSRDGSDDTVVGSDDSSQDTKLADPIMSWEKMEDADINAGIHDELHIHPWYWFLQIPTLNRKR